MALKLAGRLFTGPFSLETTTVRSNQAPVVYAIIAKGGEPWAPSFRVLDIGFSLDAGICFSELAGRSNWPAEPGAQVGVYLFYAPKSEFSYDDRRNIAAALRKEYDPPNGFVAT